MSPAVSAPPNIDKILKQIEESFPAFSAERYDCMGFLFMTLARSQWRHADRMRANERDRVARQERARRRKAERSTTPASDGGGDHA